MAATFKILGTVSREDGTRPIVAEAFVSDEDIQEWRDGESDSFLRECDDHDAAYNVFEQRYESILAHAGFTYEQAAEGGFDFQQIDA